MKRLIVAFFLLMCGMVTWAQLPIYTLYYTNPLPINPAFTGSAHKFRAGVNYRTQWSNFNSTTTGYSVYADHYFAPIKSGIGLSVYSDLVGNSNFRSTQLALYYSFAAKLKDNAFLKAGAQVSLTQTGFDNGSLTFNDQLSATGSTGNATGETLPIGSKKLYPNISAGLLFTERFFWIGVSGYNLLMPQAGYTEQSKLPIGFGLQGGFKIQFEHNTVARKIEKKQRFIMPHAMLSMVGPSKQMYVGTEVVYEPFSLGAQVRSNFFSKADGTSNVTGLALSIGIRTGYVQSNYTYEIPLSKSSLLGTSHEISLRTTLKLWERPTRRPIERLDLF